MRRRHVGGTSPRSGPHLLPTRRGSTNECDSMAPPKHCARSSPQTQPTPPYLCAWCAGPRFAHPARAWRGMQRRGPRLHGHVVRRQLVMDAERRVTPVPDPGAYQYVVELVGRPNPPALSSAPIGGAVATMLGCARSGLSHSTSTPPKERGEVGRSRPPPTTGGRSRWWACCSRRRPPSRYRPRSGGAASRHRQSEVPVHILPLHVAFIAEVGPSTHSAAALLRGHLAVDE